MSEPQVYQLSGPPLPWVDYDRAELIFRWLSDHLSFPKQTRMPGVFLSGPSGNGKSA